MSKLTPMSPEERAREIGSVLDRLQAMLDGKAGAPPSKREVRTLVLAYRELCREIEDLRDQCAQHDTALREERARTVEECAAICDADAASCRADMQAKVIDPAAGLLCHATAKGLAAGIRSLATQFTKEARR